MPSSRGGVAAQERSSGGAISTTTASQRMNRTSGMSLSMGSDAWVSSPEASDRSEPQ